MTVDLNRYSYFWRIASYRTLVYLETATSGRTVTVTGRMTVRITVIAKKATHVLTKEQNQQQLEAIQKRAIHIIFTARCTLVQSAV